MPGNMSWRQKTNKTSRRLDIVTHTCNHSNEECHRLEASLCYMARSDLKKRLQERDDRGLGHGRKCLDSGYI
jgi:hypothetical protein